MNKAQKTFAEAHSELGHLLVQIDTFYQALPEPVRKAYDNLGSGLKWGCHCDLEEHQEPDECVITSGRLGHCIFAKEGMIPNDCKYWNPIVPNLSYDQ